MCTHSHWSQQHRTVFFQDERVQIDPGELNERTQYWVRSFSFPACWVDPGVWRFFPPGRTWVYLYTFVLGILLKFIFQL